MIELRSMTEAEMTEWARRLGQPAFRGRQLFRWIHRGTKDFREMTDLPESFIEKLEQEASADPLTILRREVSKKDGTQKFLFGLPDGNTIEAVFMKYHYGNSVCVSSQAGCRMHCAFCASGLLGLSRDLTAGEIVSELYDAEEAAGQPVSHLVLMGTGEPFDNYDEVARAIRILHDPHGRNMSLRNITVSTCGLPDGIRRFTEDFPQANLAVSLHAPNDTIRRRIMPAAKAVGIGDLLALCRQAAEKTGRRITFEYALIAGVNDGPEAAEELAEKLRGMLCHVNLIPLNDVTETGLRGSGRKAAEKFCEALTARGIPATVRRTLGSDIHGACGQLRLGQTGGSE